MAFDDKENSREAGQPVRLYLFTRGPLNFAYTTADRDVTVANRTFKSVPIEDGGIQFTGQAAADDVTVTLPANTEVAQLYQAVAPADEVSATVWDWHYGVDDYRVVFVGSVASCSMTTPYSSEITLRSLTASLDASGIKLAWGRACNYALYDKNCKVAPENYKTSGRVAALDGLNITVTQASQYPDGYFSGGYLEWTSSTGVVERRGIRIHSGSSLSILAGTAGMSANLNVTIYPGCTRTTTVCNTKFNNLPNYGGAPALPGRSPFDGNPVF